MSTELKLLVPATVHPDIFAWGVHCLRYSSRQRHPDVTTEIHDLRDCDDVVQLWIEMRDRFEVDVGKAMAGVYRRSGTAELDANMGNERSYHYLAAWLLLACEERRLPPAYAPLERLLRRRGDEARALVERIDAVLAALLQPSRGAQLIVGISTYQFILLDSIFLAQRIGALFPHANIVLGGDPLDLATAREVLTNPVIDGCVTGPGEYALNEIVETVATGGDLREASIGRFANRAFFRDFESNLTRWNSAIEARADYDAVRGYPGVEWNEGANIIHILGRRGCTWASCTFCHRSHVVTKEHVFDPSMLLMQREIDRFLTSHLGISAAVRPAAQPARTLYRPGRYSPLRQRSAELYVRWDADDADVATAIKLITWLNGRLEARPPLQQKVVFYSFAPARQLSRPYAHALARAANPESLQVRLGVPIETLNPKTARTMKKGVNPIDAIKAMKVAGDSGALFAGVYFAFYPLEGLEDVRQECGYMDAALHLLVERYVPQVYIGSHRDAIGHAPEAYGIELDSSNDPLMQLLGMDIRPDSTRRYRVRGTSPLARMQNAYLSLFWSLKAWMTESIGRKRLVAILRAGRAAAAMLVWMVRLWDFSYMRRIALMYACTVLPPNRVRLFFRGGTVVRERPWFLGGRWRKALGRNETRMLRFVYERRRVSSVLSEFADVAEAPEILAQLERDRLVVRYNDHVISVVNDPVGLRHTLTDEHLAQLERLQDVEDDGAGKVRAGRRPRGSVAAAAQSHG